MKKAGLVYHTTCTISCSSELTTGFLNLILLQVFSKRKVSLLWKGAAGEDGRAGTTGEFAAALEKREVMDGAASWPEVYQATMYSQLL